VQAYAVGYALTYLNTSQLTAAKFKPLSMLGFSLVNTTYVFALA
jgi:hypothetical protein